MTTEWKPGPPPLDKPGNWVIAHNYGGTDTVLRCVGVTADGEIACVCPGFGNAARARFIRTAERHYGPIPSPPCGPTPRGD